MKLIQLARSFTQRVFLPLPKYIKTGLSVLGLLMIIGTWSPVAAQTSLPSNGVLFSDDFSGTLDKWQLIKGDVSHWQIKNGKLEAFINSRSTVTELAPKPEFWDSSWDNIALSFEMTPLQGADRNFSFWNVDTSNWAEFHFTNTILQILRVVGGRLDWLSDTPYVLNNGTTYQVVVKRYSDKMELWLNGQKIADHTEHNPLPFAGPFAMRAGAGAISPVKVVFDNLKVESLEDESAFIPLKQTDPRWDTALYNSADKWASTPTIGRWGCLLTSLVMNFTYHGLTKLPSGEALTPLSLNAWLLNQPDGFIGEGLINWQAVTRLSKLIHDVYGTPKLEYQRHTGSTLTTAIQGLRQNLLPILNIPGHFLVATGVLSNGNDLAISDPSFSYTKLSEHPEQLQSTRLLIPSYTDLSYIMITHQPKMRVQLLDPATRQPIAGVSTEIEYLKEDGPQSPTEETQHLAITQLAKPETQKYLIEFSTWEDQTYEPGEMSTATIYSYGSTAVFETWKVEVPVSSEKTLYLLEYEKEQTSYLKPIVSFSSIEQNINEGYEKKQLKSKTVVQKLTRITSLGKETDSSQHSRVALLLEKTMQVYQKAFEPAFFVNITSQIQQLKTQLEW